MKRELIAWKEWLPALQQAPEWAAPLAPLTTLQVGGLADVLLRPSSWDELAAVQRATQVAGVPLTLLGKGSNVMVLDGGVRGVVVHVAKGLDAVRVAGNRIYAEAGAASGTVARAAREAGLGGLAFLGGIPGSVGGALKMNAGAYGGETFAQVKKIWVMNSAGEVLEQEPAAVQPGYRHTKLPAGWWFVAAEWELAPAAKEEIRAQMQEINRARSTTQPLALPSSGSWFKNVRLPQDGPLGAAGTLVNAWRVVDAAGCRGWREGGAMVSEQHANFFVNIGLKEGRSATAAEMLRLDARVRDAVRAKLGIELEREVRLLGEA